MLFGEKAQFVKGTVAKETWLLSEDTHVYVRMYICVYVST